MIRDISQWFSFGISLFIIVEACISMSLRPDKRWTLIAWAAYGAVNAIFYILVLFFNIGILGSELSPIRSLIKDTLVASMVFFASLEDFQKRIRSWKQ